MAILNLNSNTITNPREGILLSDIIYVPTRVIRFVQNNTGLPFDNTDNGFSQTSFIEKRKYDLNNPYEYGAFIEDSLSGFVDEQLPGTIGNAYSELKNKNISVDRKQQILENGRPYTYTNTKRLAAVKQEDSLYVLLDIVKPTIYEYNYDNKCERLDFEQRVQPGVNKNNPSSPCQTNIEIPNDSGSFMEIGQLSASFVDFDDYRGGFKTEFKEIGFRTTPNSELVSFSPKRFEYVSQSIILDQFEDIASGPVRVVEEQVDGVDFAIRTDLVVYQQLQRKNLRTGQIVSGSGDEVEIFRTTISQTDIPIFIYKQFGNDSIRSIPLYNITSGVWNGNGSLYEFHTSSIQTELEKSYKLDVYSGSCDDTKMFTIYYGDLDGAGTRKISNDRKKTGYSKSVYSMFASILSDNTVDRKIKIGDNSLSQSLYIESVLKLTTNLKVDDVLKNNFRVTDGVEYIPNYDNDIVYMDQDGFYLKYGLSNNPDAIKKLLPARNLSKVYVIQINPKLLQNTIDEGNFQLSLARVSASGVPEPDPDVIPVPTPPLGGWGVQVTADPDSDYVLKLIDNSRIYNAELEYDNRDALRYNSTYTVKSTFDLVSGSIEDGVYQNTTPIVYGLVYPSYGLIIIDAEKLDTELSLSLYTGLNQNGENPRRLFESIKGAALQTNVRSDLHPFIMRNHVAKTVDSIEIFIEKHEFNYSTNPSYYNARERSPFFRTNQSSISNGKQVDEYTFKFRQFYFEPMSYITTIGLYNDNYELLAVGKLSKPIKKTFYDSFRFKVNITY